MIQFLRVLNDIKILINPKHIFLGLKPKFNMGSFLFRVYIELFFAYCDPDYTCDCIQSS